MKRKPAKKAAAKLKTKNNSLDQDMLSGVFSGAGQMGIAPLSQPFELSANSQVALVTLQRILLTYAYSTHGVVQTIIDVPVEDAVRGGIIFKSDELDAEELKLLTKYFDELVLPPMKSALKWSELYGGAALIVSTDQDPETELDEEAIGLDSPLAFIDADRWELPFNYMGRKDGIDYTYYGLRMHNSRVLKINGREAPSMIRQRLQGWGMSVLERLIRPINAYIKNEDVIYELLDEAKIDIWRIDDFNSQVLNNLARGKTEQRLSLATLLKNYHNAIVMDKEDEYDQKQITFAGLPDILEQNRIGMAASARMPMAKLFGLSAAGFNSGEDDIENYNAMVEGEPRARIRFLLPQILPLICRQLFGFAPEVEFEFHPLRVLTAEQEENVKNAKFTRATTLKNMDMVTGKELADHLKEENIFTMETEVSKGLREPEPMQAMGAEEEAPEDGKKKTPKDGKDGK